MKTLLVLIGLLSASAAFTLSSSEISNYSRSPLVLKKTLQDRGDLAFNNMVNQLRSLHNSLYNLPYTQEYIQSHILPQVNAQRKIVAPHYPERESYGENSEEAYKQLRIWFETYPMEYSNYVAFLKEFIASHS